MWLALVPADQWGLGSGQSYDSGHVRAKLHPWIGMKAADGSFFPWNPNNLDVLAIDWCLASGAAQGPPGNWLTVTAANVSLGASPLETVHDDRGRDFELSGVSGIVNHSVSPLDFNNTEIRVGDFMNVVFTDPTRPADPRVADSHWVGAATYRRTK